MTFNILDYGAVPDGKTDSTAAIQTCIDKAGENGGEVLVPAGKYSTGSLRISGKGVAFTGVAAWGFQSDGGSVLILNDESADCMLNITGGFGCSIRGLCFNGGQLGKNIHGIKLYWDEYNGGSEEDSPTIDECRIGCFTGNGIHFEHVWCFTLRHSMIHRNFGAGLYIDGWDAFILDNWFTANRGGGIRGGETACSITATGNRIEWNKTSGIIIPDGCCVNLTGNYIDRSFGPALYLGGGKNVDSITATGNIFYRSGALKDGEEFSDPYLNSHIYLKGVKGSCFSGNSFRVGRNDNGTGEYSPDFAVVLDGTESVVITGNSFFGGSMKDSFVFVSDNEATVIENNSGEKN